MQPNDIDALLGSIGTQSFKDQVKEVAPSLELDDNNTRAMQALANLVETYQNSLENSGTGKWFVDGTPYSIQNCPKHNAFFGASKEYTETLFIAGNRCHVAGTKVWMADGSEKDIELVVLGDKVLAYDIETSSLVETTVVDTYAGISDNVYEYKSGHRRIGTTSDHKFLTVTQSNQYSEKQVGSLNYWDKVVIPREWNPEVKDPGFSENVAKLLGLLVGDGYLSAREDQFKLTNTDIDILEFAGRVAAEELECSPRLQYNRTSYDLYFPKAKKSNKKSKLAELLVNTGLYGTVSSNKFVPESILLAPVGHVRAFLQGLFAADAHYRKGRVTLYTTSLLLAATVEKACLRLGVDTTRNVKKHKNPAHADCYSVEISGDDNVFRIGNAFNKRVTPFSGSRQKNEIRRVSVKQIEKLPKQEVYCITVSHKDHLFVANGYITANCGKTLAGAFAMACHLTGVYPSWWNGKTFDRPIKAWAAGSDAKSTRDTVQKELLGPIGNWGTGLIPKEKIGRYWALSGVPQGVDTVEIKHISGGMSTLGFKNYQQQLSAFYGTSMDVIWLDEICPADIYNECLIRTMTTDGIVFVTFTPLEGLTPLVVNFFSKAKLLAGSKPLLGVSAEQTDEDGIDSRLANRKTAKAIVTAGWDDAPWLTEEAKARMLDDTPPHLRAARSKGEPSMGSGNIYPIPLSDILIKPFEIPPYYERICGFDVGWNNTAAVWVARNPDTGVCYMYDEYLRGGEEPAIHASAVKSRGTWIPVMIDPASRGRSQVDGRKLMDMYRSEDLLLYPANNEVESGILNVWNHLSTGKLKIFETLPKFQREYTLYRRDLNGKVIKENDHLLDALRYAMNALIRAISKQQATSISKGMKGFTSSIKYDI